MKHIGIIIVDDHPIVLEGLSNLLEKRENIRILASFEDADAAFYHYLEQKEVDIIFLDIHLKTTNGVAVCAEIKKRHPNIRVIGISGQSELSGIRAFMKSDADGYLLKNAHPNEFYDAVEKVLRNQKVFSPQIVDRLLAEEKRENTLPKLTKREKEIIALLDKGASTQDVANKLFLSPLTVQTHRRNLLQKYDVKNLQELLNKLKEHQMLDESFPE